MNIAKVGVLPSNTLGRDFIIGDLHGHYDTLMHLLCENHFDKKIDRVISVGDVIDRGPRSWDCLQLFREPWFHGVMGNHELALSGMALTAQKSIKEGLDLSKVVERARERSKGMCSEWFADWLTVKANHKKLEVLIGLLAAIPDIITVRGDGVSYNVVHAELMGAGIKTDTDIATVAGMGLTDMDSIKKTLALKCSRKLFNRAKKVAPGDKALGFDAKNKLSLTFCGHNVTARPFIWKNHFFLDTGCGFEEPALRDFLGLSAFILPDSKFAFAASMVERKQAKTKHHSSRQVLPATQGISN